MGGESEGYYEEVVMMTDKEKAFEYDEEFVQKLSALGIRVDFYTNKSNGWNCYEPEVTTSWSFSTMKEARLEEFARIDVEENRARARLDKSRNVFDILGFQAAMEVLALITAKEKQLNEILKGK